MFEAKKKMAQKRSKKRERIFQKATRVGKYKTNWKMRKTGHSQPRQVFPSAKSGGQREEGNE